MRIRKRTGSGVPATVFSLLLATLGCSDDGTGPAVDDGAWVQVQAGSAHVCALTTSGAAYCWGGNPLGQAGVTANPVLQPTPVDTDLRFASLSAGGDNSCGITDDGALFCWGSNKLGQLGNGGILGSHRPLAVAAERTWSAVSVGTYHVCAINAEAALHCWGADRFDVALGHRATSTCIAPNSESRWPCAGVPMPIDAGGVYEWVEAGLYQTCAGSQAVGALCWGTNDAGQLGVSTVETCLNNDALHPLTRTCARAPTAPAGPMLNHAAPGATHGCGLGALGVVSCWGALVLNFGQIGNGDQLGTAAPVPIATSSTFLSVATSHENHVRTFSCGIASDGQGYCWGANRFGQLGTDTEECAGTAAIPCGLSPIAIEATAALEAVTLGLEFACALTRDSEILCWGFNEQGQLGDGSAISRTTPGPVNRS